MNHPLDKLRTKYHDANPPTAFRAWSYWAGVCRIGCLQVPMVREFKTSGASTDDYLNMLCEVYARAIFETLFSPHFDGSDSEADKHVLSQITDMFGPKVAGTVILMVSEKGPTIRRAEKLGGKNVPLSPEHALTVYGSPAELGAEPMAEQAPGRIPVITYPDGDPTMREHESDPHTEAHNAPPVPARTDS